MPRTVQSAIAIALVLMFIAMLLAVIWPQVGSGPASRELNWKNQLRNIGVALHNYHSEYGSFPPAVIVDPETGHRHSWRIVLLPYLDQHAAFRQYRFDEPWNSETNLKLQDFSIFTAPCDDEAHKNHWTSAAAVVGQHTMWPESGSQAIDDVNNVIDPLAQKLFAVEVTNSGIHWMEPRDLHFDTMNFRIDNQDAAGIGSCNKAGPLALLVNGRVDALDQNTDATILKSMLIIDDEQQD